MEVTIMKTTTFGFVLDLGMLSFSEVLAYWWDKLSPEHF